MDTNPTGSAPNPEYPQPEFPTSQPVPVKYRAWAKQVQISAIFAAISSLLGGLSFFELGKIAVGITGSISTSEAFLGLAALVGVLALLVGRIWFEVAIIGFGFRATQTAVSKGYVTANKPGWFIASWFVPVVSIYLPGMLLSKLAEFSAGPQAKVRKREAWTFWICWTLVLLIFSAASNSTGAHPTPVELTAVMAGFGVASAFQAVPVILARSLVSKLRNDIDNLT